MNRLSSDRFEHDCDRCKYLGSTFSRDGSPVDVYECPATTNNADLTWIGRFGSLGPDYSSIPKSIAVEMYFSKDDGSVEWKTRSVCRALTSEWLKTAFYQHSLEGDPLVVMERNGVTRRATEEEIAKTTTLYHFCAALGPKAGAEMNKDFKDMLVKFLQGVPLTHPEKKRWKVIQGILPPDTVQF